MAVGFHFMSITCTIFDSIPLMLWTPMAFRPGAPVDSGDPVPFPVVEGRWTDWLGLTVYGLLVVMVCLVAWRMARAPEPSSPDAGSPGPVAGEGPHSDVSSGHHPPVA